MSRAFTILILVVLAGLLGITTWSLNRNSASAKHDDHEEKPAEQQAAVKQGDGGQLDAARTAQLQKQLEAKKKHDAEMFKGAIPPKPKKPPTAITPGGPTGEFDPSANWFKNRPMGKAGVETAEKAAAAYEKDVARKPLRLPIPNMGKGAPTTRMIRD